MRLIKLSHTYNCLDEAYQRSATPMKIEHHFLPFLYAQSGSTKNSPIKGELFQLERKEAEIIDLLRRKNNECEKIERSNTFNK